MTRNCSVTISRRKFRSPPTNTGCRWRSTPLSTARSLRRSTGLGLPLKGPPQPTLRRTPCARPQAGSFPTLRDAITAALNNYSVDYNVAIIRNQPPGTINVNELSGSVKFSGSYSVPISVNSLASASLPFKQKIAVSPDATLQPGWRDCLTGQFVVRSHRVSDS